MNKLISNALFFIFLVLFSLSPLFTQERNLHSLAPIAVFPSVELDPLAPETPEKNIEGATVATLFTPVFLGQDSQFLVLTPTKCCTAHRSDHEYGNESAFAGILKDGSIYAWSEETCGGNSPSLPTHKDGTPKKAKSIISNQNSFLAILDDDSLWAWGEFGSNPEDRSSSQGWGSSSNHNSKPTGKEVKLPSQKKVGCCVASTAQAFAMILNDDSLFACGSDLSAGKTPPLPKDETGSPKKPCCLYSNQGTFTAIFPDKTLLAWGNLHGGGKNDSRTFSLPTGKKLRSCCSLAATEGAFAGILDDESIAVWGKSAGQFKAPRLPVGKKPLFIIANDTDFTVLLEDPEQNQSFLSWGINFSNTEEKLPKDRKIKADCCVVATQYAFATILDNGAIFAWGAPHYGGKLLDQPRDRKGKVIEACCLVANDGAFSATLQDGSVMTWGNYWYGGTCWYNHGNIFPPDEENTIYASSTKPLCLVANHAAFSATINDGTALAWGSYSYGGNLCQVDESIITHNVDVKLYARSIVPAQGATIISLVSNGNAFAAVTDAGSLLKWGASSCGGGDDEEIEPKDLPGGQKLIAIASILKKQLYYDHDELAGIALVGNAASLEQGKWQYLSCENHEWKNIPQDLSETQALVLSAGAKIRFLPELDFIGNVAPLTVKLLDVKKPVITGSFIDTTLETYVDSCSANMVALKTAVKED
ncbi:MAG: hypothetical protein ACOYK6_06340 [Chthoniobacterales bacterium]